LPGNSDGFDGHFRSGRAVHALPSAVREVSGVSGVSDREPGSPSRSHPLAVGSPSEFGQLRSFRYRNCRVGEPERRARPVRMQAAGRAVRCLPHPSGLGSTMHRATTRGSNATGRHYNSSAHRVNNCGRGSQFRFREFFRTVEGVHLAGSSGPRRHSLCRRARVPAMLSSQRGASTGNSPRNGHASCNPRGTQLQPVKTSVASYWVLRRSGETSTSRIGRYG